MKTRDELIGENVVRLRGDISQKDLAERMRTRGWKWSQATVWSIEKGERPLRLAEAEDLAKILDLKDVNDLLQLPRTYVFFSAMVRFDASQDDLINAAAAYQKALAELAVAGDELAAEHGAEYADAELTDIDFAMGPAEWLQQMRDRIG